MMLWKEEDWRLSLQAFATKMYTDRAQVWRMAEEKRPDGTTVLRRRAVGATFACRLSRVSSRKDGYAPGLPQQELQYEGRLYMAPGTDVRAGDRIDLQRGGSAWTRKYLAGDGFEYESHMELPLLRWEEA